MAVKRAAFLLLSLLALSAAFAWASEEEEEELEVGVEAEAIASDVLVLDATNFTDTVEKYDFIVVEFYAPWCGHCKKLAPEYEEAATVLKSHDPPIILAKMDADQQENKAITEELGVKGYPTLTIFRKKGDVILEYKGPRETAGIISYLKKQAGPPSVELTSAENAQEFLSENEKELILVGVFESLDGEEYENFVKVAETERSNYVFASTVDASYLPDNGVPLKTPSVRFYKDFDDKTADFTDFSPEALTEFIQAESFQLVTEMSRNPAHRPALMKFFESSNDKVFLFTAGPQTEDATAALLASFRKDAKAFKPKGFIFLFSEEGESANAIQYFGLEQTDLPAYVLQSDKGKKFIAKNIKAEDLAPWLEDYQEGKLKEHIKSDPIPPVNDEPVKVIVADSIKEAVLEAGKDVFLEFYAPWCGHCKKLAPILEEVAVHFESDPDILIANFDATTNDPPSDLFEVKGFPTIYFYSAAGEITPYEGERTKEAIIEFINENRSNAVESDEAVEEEVVEEHGSGSENLHEVVKDTTDVKDEL